VLAAYLAAACGGHPPVDPAAAQLAAAEGEIDTRPGLARCAARDLQVDARQATAPRHPADGGRAWISSVQDADGRRVAARGRRVRIRLIYEASPLGAL
jgi:hypothetical protein